MNQLTQILDAIQQGKPGATEELRLLVYEELRRLAAYKWPMNRIDYGECGQAHRSFH